MPGPAVSPGAADLVTGVSRTPSASVNALTSPVDASPEAAVAPLPPGPVASLAPSASVKAPTSPAETSTGAAVPEPPEPPPPAQVATSTLEPAAEPEPVAAAQAVAITAQILPSTLKAAAMLGARAAREFLEEIGPGLPCGGAAAAALVAQLIGMVEGSIVNRDNLDRLRDRTVDLFDLIQDKKEDLLSKKMLRGIIARFSDLLLEIVSYTKQYATRSWFGRMLFAKGDAAHYNALHRQLGDLTADCTVAIVLDVHTGVIDVHTGVNKIQETQQAYVDHKATLNRMIADAGGVKALMANEQEFHRILQMKQTCSTFQADQDLEGAHQLIEQPALRVFWRKLFRHEYSIRWEAFWEVFPAQLHKIADVPRHEVQEILDILGNDEARREVFKANVEKSDPGSVSATELQRSFPSEVPLVDRVKELAAVAGGAQAAAPRRCDIPPLDPVYCGRAGVAAELASSLASGLCGQQPATALCIVASAGYGKSSIAHDIAWRLWESQAAAGVVLVDTRKVYTKREVDSAFCTALQLDQDASDSRPKILARLRAMVSDAANGGPHGPAAGAVLLVVVDNAEDPIAGPGCAHLMGLLDQVQAGVPGARLLITSREAVPGGDTGSLTIHHHTLPELQQEDAAQVVRRYVDDELVSADEVAEVARICGGIPLVLRLVADALKSGRVVMEGLRNAMAAHEDDMDLKVLNVLLTALPKGQQMALAQLSVFPTIFSEKGAAAAMLCDAPKAKALLAVLLKHGLVRYSSSEGVYSLHPRVQQAASASAENLQATREECALHCIENLSFWTLLYSSGGKSSAYALQQGWQHQADIAMLLSLLGQAEVPVRVAEKLTIAATPAAFGRFLYPLGMMGSPEMVAAWRNISKFYE
ncbi:hypothetical protein TSOC_006113 [Tetrabaena socialis]|uniref:NB-ARC domain-containing protein n=1 Tax=Tetrabaena socialis TaxID=47790 RepID=A0A2J8A4K1_9CHLO|nr:hypothetical protein TSOC_006113 [Tetrabaena socialis]|eukprot:PNH07438.1 hypothetical protein TSOC_006113 [Tetrabaena socialis]